MKIYKNEEIDTTDSLGLDDYAEHNLPNWEECRLRVGNEEYLKKHDLEDDGESPMPNELHRFIYEYDDSDSFRSSWFLHRLEKLVVEVKNNPELFQGCKRLNGYDRGMKRPPCIMVSRIKVSVPVSIMKI